MVALIGLAWRTRTVLEMTLRMQLGTPTSDRMVVQKVLLSMWADQMDNARVTYQVEGRTHGKEVGCREADG